MALSSRRFPFEERGLKAALESGSINDYEFSDDHTAVIVNFNGPKGTEYESESYILKIVFNSDYPFKPANGFFMSTPPNHKFYKWNDDNPSRRTNIANTDFGLNYNWNPQINADKFVERVKYSLTPEGTIEHYPHMESRD